MATQRQAGKATSARKAAQPQASRAQQAGKAGPTGKAGQTGRNGQAGRTGRARQAEGTAPVASGVDADGSARAGRAAPAEPLWRRLAAYPRGHKLEFTTMVASVLGLAVSIYLTIEHFTQNSYALCPANSTFNCGKVTTSAQSHVFGIPVAVLGLAFFVFMVAVNSPWAWRARHPVVHWARLVSVVVGIVFVLYLVYAELFLVNAICLYCTSVHVLTFILFALIVARATLTGVQPAAGRR
jgi:uncharacterized membrane protein